MNQLTTISLPSNLILYHQRRQKFANGGNKPYHTFNYFCRHPYYDRDLNQSPLNTYLYQTTCQIEKMVQLTENFDWDDLRRCLGVSTRNEYQIISCLLNLGYNGLFYDTVRGNEYIFSRKVVESSLSCVCSVINDDSCPTKEESGYYCIN